MYAVVVTGGKQYRVAEGETLKVEFLEDSPSFERVINPYVENLRSLGFRGEYRVMENGVDFPRGRATEAEIAAITQRHHLPQDRPVFLFIGRMRWYKGIRLILDGLACFGATNGAL